MLSRERRLGMLVAFISTVTAVYAVELGLYAWSVSARIAEAQRLERLSVACPGRWTDVPQCAAAFELGEPFDARPPLEVLEGLEQDGTTWWPAIHAGFFRSGALAIDELRVVPLGGISNARALLCNESGEWVTFIADEHGFNNPTGTHRPGAPIALVGDSFIHGYCVTPSRSLSALVDSEFPGTVNVGLAGAGPLTELAALREYIAPLRPPIVVWAYFGENDISDLRLETDNDILMAYLEPGFAQGLAELQDDLDRALADTLTALRDERDRQRAARNARRRAARPRSLPSTIAGVLKLRSTRRLWRRAMDRPPKEPFPDDLFLRVLRTARDEVASWDGELVFLALPEWARYGRPGASTAYYAEGIKSARDLELRVIDAVALFDTQPDPLSLFPRRSPGHYTEEGYRLVAAEITRSLRDLTVGGDAASP